MVFLLTGEGREDVPILSMSGDAHIQKYGTSICSCYNSFRKHQMTLFSSFDRFLTVKELGALGAGNRGMLSCIYC